MEIDPKFDEAVELFLSKGRASWVLLDRALGIGMRRADAIMAEMVNRGIISAAQSPKNPQILITQEDWTKMKLFRSLENRSDEDVKPDSSAAHLEQPSSEVTKMSDELLKARYREFLAS